jgi:hypothetical protein
MVIKWLSRNALGPREQAIPGEWAMLVLIVVAAGVLGFLVLWFTMLRRERTVLHRARPSSSLGPELIGDSATALFTGHTTSPAVTKYEPIHDADSADSAVGADNTPDDSANDSAAPIVDPDAVEPEASPASASASASAPDSGSAPEPEPEPDLASAPEPDPAAEPPTTPEPPPAPKTPRARRRPKKRRRSSR